MFELMKKGNLIHEWRLCGEIRRATFRLIYDRGFFTIKIEF